MTRIGWSLLAAVMLVPTIAAAQPAKGAKEQAQSLADQGYQAYEANDWVKAVGFYLESYKLVTTSEILFNIASIYDRKINDPQLALEFYRRYNASTDTKPELVAKATVRIAALNAQLDGSARGGGGGAVAADSGSNGSGWRTAGLVTGAVGIVGLGVGAVTGLVANGKHQDAKRAGCSGDTCPTVDAQQQEKDAGSMANVSTVGFVAGGVLLAAGAAMFFLAPGSRTEQKPSTALRLTPSFDPRGGAAVFVTGTLF